MMTTDTIEGELTCCICLELFSDPVILPCSHNLCRQCALGLTHKGVLGPLEYILCPHCRNQSKLTALAENRTLANIVSIYKSNSQNIQSAKPCFVHRSRVQTFYCLTCKAPICNECTSVTSGLHRAHNFIDLESFFAETKASSCSAYVFHHIFICWVFLLSLMAWYFLHVHDVFRAIQLRDFLC
jgi:hypothetical protein